MGQEDLFVTHRKRGSWTSPSNLGYPINTPGHESYLTVDAKGEDAYMSSIRPGGEGHADIYHIDLSNYNLPQPVPVTVIQGKILNQKDSIIPGAQLHVIQRKSDRKNVSYKKNIREGSYLLAIPEGQVVELQAFKSEHSSPKKKIETSHDKKYDNRRVNLTISQ